MILSREKIKYYLFYLLLILLPFNFHHIFNFQQIKNIEGFRENISYSFYAFDIVFLIIILVLLLDASIDAPKVRTWIRTQAHILSAAILFLFILTISSCFSSDRTISFYATARVAEVILFFFVAKQLLKSKKIFDTSLLIIFLSGTLQSIIAIAQFIFQKSIGLKLLGESIIAPDILGVAKVEVYGEKMIRAYGTFPHPNLLGAFLLLSLACGIYLISKNIIMSFPRRRESGNSQILVTGYWLLTPIIVAIILSFSRSVWLATFLFLFIILILHLLEIGKLRIYWILDVGNWKLHKILIAIAIIIFVALFLSPRLCINCPGDESFALRKIYSQTAYKIIQAHPFIGIGPGNFTSTFTPCNCSCGPQPWEIQPVHNLYLLIASETGLIGFIVFLLFVFSVLLSFWKLKYWKFIGNWKLEIGNSKQIMPEKIKLSNIFFLLFLSFLLLAFFDHYFWTLPQGQFLFWLTLALATTSEKTKK